MELAKETLALIQKEFLLEWRQKYAINGILLYLASTVFICYLSFGNSKLFASTWNALFWIILLFTSVNAVAKSFMQERAARHIYYYSVASPQGIILSKIVYNAIIMSILALMGFGMYSVVLGNPVQDKELFLINILLGAIGFSTTLTMISGIASKGNNSSTLMAILSFPVIIPMLLLLIKISKNAIDGLAWSVSSKDVLILVSINVMLGALSYLLFPYLWRS
ncbi:MAG: heme exporter protein CcmB [Cytophagaceae bacterium]|nr:heme exporter protein CcmB [Cytophagaceae bacterium]